MLQITLSYVYFFMNSRQDISVAEALLPVIYSAMDQHFVVLNQNGNVAFARSWHLLGALIDSLQLCPQAGVDGVLEKIIG